MINRIFCHQCEEECLPSSGTQKGDETVYVFNPMLPIRLVDTKIDKIGIKKGTQVYFCSESCAQRFDKTEDAQS